MNTRFNHLHTDFERELTDIPFKEHPRPQFKREKYFSLNGWWDYCVQSKNGNKSAQKKILVPFCPESRLSGVFERVKKGDLLIYSRNFTLDKSFNLGKVILHVDECDQSLKVIINGKDAYEGEGVLAHEIDITDYLQEDNSLQIIAKDNLDKAIPYGKQRAKRGGMWYTKTSGIKKSVWLESMPKSHITDLKISTDLTSVTLTVKGGCDKKKVILCDKEYEFCGQKIRIEIENPKLWSPSQPHLYYFELICEQDKISSYFGLRQISIDKIGDRNVILFNGKPFFFHALLDQGYYSDGICLPATEKGFEYDVLTIKKYGFNTLRKHVKLEPEIFYYYCDKYGMLVFQDMINSGNYNFLRDTALPTLFLKRGITHIPTKRRKNLFINTSLGIIDQLYNHPSVVYYTIFNEGWGQFGEKACYRLFKSVDNSRIYDTTSGWFKRSCTDVESDHVYFRKVKGKKTKKPWVVSEFGGYSYKIKEHAFNKDKNYGYKYFSDKESFNNAIINLYTEQIIPAIEGGLCGCVLTQVSDVEDETNGFLTYDRKVLKVDQERFYKTSKKIYDAFNKQAKKIETKQYIV